MTLPNDPWAPFEPTTKDPWDLRKVGHLHRRAGFGATWTELRRDLNDGPEASVARLFAPTEPTADEREALDTLRGALNDVQRLKAWWLSRIVYGTDPLREKLTLFWHGHFATSIRKVQSMPRMLRQNETFRRHALGEFAGLLTDMISDPAMLVWLDGNANYKGNINENFGREFLELFTLGIGNYGEADVRAAARSFTGWVEVTGGTDGAAESRHNPAEFDDGEKTFLKQRGNWNSADMVRITLEQPACAEFLCRKLYKFFVSESAAPGDDLIRPLAERFRSHGYSVRHVMGILLRSRHFYDQAVYRQRAKGPVEFSAGLVRSLGLAHGDVRLLALAAACDRQRQALFAPHNVKGWDGGRSWFHDSVAVLERGNWVADLVWGNPDLGQQPFDPLAWAERQGVPGGKVAEALLDVTLEADLSETARSMILDAAATGTANGLRQALQLALHYPAYQLA
jgi:uncharacterized protein (DUF1800 family)